MKNLNQTYLGLLLLYLCCSSFVIVQGQIDPNNVTQTTQFQVTTIPLPAPFHRKVVPAGPAHIIPVPKDLKVTTPGANDIPLARTYKVQRISVSKFLPKSNLILPPKINSNAIGDIQTLDASQGILSSSVNCLLEDRNGNLWIGYVAGISRYNGSSLTDYATPEILSWGGVESIIEDNKGNIWFGTESGGIICFDGNSFTKLTIDEFEINNVRSIVEDREGRIWFGSTEGIFILDHDTFKHYNTEHGLSFNAVTSMLEDTEGNIWIGTFAGGLNKYDGKSFTQFTTKDGISSQRIQCLFQDDKE